MTKTSWKTTLAGVVAIATAIIHSFFPEYDELAAKITVGLVGLGLIAARDNGVSSEDAGAK